MTYEQYVLNKVINKEIKHYELILESVLQTKLAPSTYLKDKLDKRVVSTGLKSIFGFIEDKGTKSYNAYFYSEYRKEVLKEDTDSLKICSNCKMELSLSNFYSNGYYKNTRKYKSKCKKCTEAELHDRKEQIILSIFKSYSCTICGYKKCKKALEFHHKNPKEKEYKISDLKSHSAGKITEELHKCIIVCANCHREIHEGLHPEYLLTAK